MARLDELKWAAEVTKESIGEADADKRSPLIGQYRALLAEIAELEGESGVADEKREVNGLVILQEELAKRRQSGAAGSRRPGSRNI